MSDKELDELILTGTLLEGPDVDLIELSGLNLSDEEQDRIWDEISPRNLLVDCLNCEEIEVDEFEGGPGMSDSTYEYRCGSRDSFVKRLSEILLQKAGRSAG